MKACHRTKKPTHQRKLEVAMTEGKRVLLYKEQCLENCLNETLYSVMSAKNKAPVPCCSILAKKLLCVNQQLDGSFSFLVPKGILLSWQSIPPSVRETAACSRDLA